MPVLVMVDQALVVKQVSPAPILIHTPNPNLTIPSLPLP